MIREFYEFDTLVIQAGFRTWMTSLPCLAMMTVHSCCAVENCLSFLLLLLLLFFKIKSHFLPWPAGNCVIWGPRGVCTATYSASRKNNFALFFFQTWFTVCGWKDTMTNKIIFFSRPLRPGWTPTCARPARRSKTSRRTSAMALNSCCCSRLSLARRYKSLTAVRWGSTR